MEAGELVGSTNKATAERALRLLVASDPAYRVVDGDARAALAAVFARRNYVIYGKAFDAVHVAGAGSIDLTDEAALARKEVFDRISLVEIKSTNVAKTPPDFRGFFFSLSTAELLVAQNLGHRFRFAFVNTLTAGIRVVTMREVLASARAVYPSWSIRLDGLPEGIGTA